MQVLAVVPARGGSAAIPRKNLAEVGGKPLLQWAVESALGGARVSRVIVSTDDEEIARLAQRLGAEVPFLRPAALAASDTPMLPVLQSLAVELRVREGYQPDVIVLLQPTSPLRRASHIDEALELLAATGADSVVSVVPIPHQFVPGAALRLEAGRLRPYEPGPAATRRQDKPLLYARNGPAVLATRLDVIVAGSLYGDDSRPYVMDPHESVDVDTPFDLEVADWLLRRHR
ncbi:MAG: acylneuraminate cytidylyltransferase family protein [Acidobacteriota bacterium]